MENDQKLLAGHTDLEKGAYLGAIASIASADRTASEEEIEYLSDLADAADLSERQKQAVIRAATEVSGEDLTRCLDILKNSELKYSLLTDLMAFAKADGEYTDDEKENVDKIAQYLGVNEQQYSLLDEFSDKASAAEAAPEEVAKPGFLSALGLNDKMSGAGINGNSLIKNLLSVAGPMVLAGLVSRGIGGRGRSAGGFLGGNSLGGGALGGGGGLGSLIGMLSGGRSFGNAGGLLGRIFGRGF